MDLKISGQRFIVGGAGAGLGLAVAQALLSEGAHIIAIARSAEKLEALKRADPARVQVLAADLTRPETLHTLEEMVGTGPLHGILVNAGGPPAKTFMETSLEDWDQAYHHILRWKLALTKTFVPKMMAAGYGRLVFIESSAVKQPLENLVLSNSIRLAVVGFVKTLSQEIAASGVTLNIIGPGAHDTAAITRLYQKKSEQTGISVEQAREQGIGQIPVRALGRPEDLAALACWLFSPASRYLTGQTLTVDGGMGKGTFG